MLEYLLDCNRKANGAYFKFKRKLHWDPAPFTEPRARAEMLRMLGEAKVQLDEKAWQREVGRRGCVC